MKKTEQIASKVYKEIRGRMCEEHGPGVVVSDLLLEVGGGNYIEFGSLFGGSAIVAAITMEEFQLEGHIYGVDPFNGYYKGTLNDSGDPVYSGDNDIVTGIPITLEQSLENAKMFGVEDRVTFIKAHSVPLPLEVSNKTFSVALIDGDHWNEGPLNDFVAINKLVTDYIVFDNYNMTAVNYAVEYAVSCGEWVVCLEDKNCCVLRRVITE